MIASVTPRIPRRHVLSFGPVLTSENLRKRREIEGNYIKLAKTQSDIIFLTQCKKLDLFPAALKIHNPLQSWGKATEYGERICRRASGLLRNAAIRSAYARQSNWVT